MKIILSLFFVLLHSVLSYAYNQFSFVKYQVENGLSHNTVWYTIQDHQGFMWFGTSDGLNRFDGKNFKIFRHIPKDSSCRQRYVPCRYADCRIQQCPLSMTCNRWSEYNGKCIRLPIGQGRHCCVFVSG